MKKTSLLAVLMLMTFTLIAVGSANAAACSNSSLKGVWGFQYHGFLPSGEYIVGEVLLNSAGKGTFAAGTTGQEAVQPATQTPLTLGAGSGYTATGATTPNCEITLTLNLPGSALPSPAHFYGTENGGGKIDAIEIDGTPTNQIVVNGFAQETGETITGCTNALSAGTVSFHSEGPIAAVGGWTNGEGQLVLTAAGGESGTVTLFLAGVGLVPLAPGVGSFSANPDCTGTSTLSVAAGAFVYDTFTIAVNKGANALFVVSDAGSVVYGETTRK